MKKKGKVFLSVLLIVSQHLISNVTVLAQDNVCFTSIFDNAHSVSVGTLPHSAAPADFNNDGKLDLVITNTGSASLSLLLGDGDGKFPARKTIEVGSQPTGVTAADFNGDGRTDIAFADQEIDLAMVLFGNGDGTFQTPTGFFVGDRPLAMVSADFNSDGKADLATTNYYSNDIAVSLNNGTGTFPDATTIATGAQPYAITTGDFNGDGFIDLATANNDVENFMAGNISVFIGNGSGGFLPRADYISGWNPIFVTSADLNGDGRSDLIASNSGSQDISVLLAKASGGFNTPANHSIVGQPGHISIADFDGDGFKDVAVIDIQSSNIAFFNGNASGSLTRQDSYALGGSTGSIISCDLNDDAEPDLVVLKPMANSLDIWLGESDSMFEGIKTNQVGVSPGALVIADFDLDGKKDIATSNFDSDNVSILLSNAAGNLNAAINSAAGSNPSSIAVADFNSDDKPDIAVANYSANKVSLLIGNGDGSFDAPLSYYVGSSPQKIVSADFNGDSKMDIGAFNSHDNNISVLYGDGAGSFSDGTIVTGGPSISDFVSEDFNKDGRFDLAVLDWNESNVTLILSNGTGNFTQGPKYPVGINPSMILTADMDSDGNVDLVVSGRRYNISILKGTGTGTLLPRVDYTAEIPYSITVADFNNDNKSDIGYSSASKSLSVLLAKSTTGFLPATSLDADVSLLSGSDLNNDGLIDIVGNIASHVVVLHNNTSIIKASGPTSFCSGNSVILSATANGHTYQWNSGGSTTKDLTVTTGGSYYVTITNQNGSCSSTSNTITVSVPPVAPEVAIAHPICDGTEGSITVNIRNGSDTYSFDNGLTFQASNVKTDLTPGSYRVIIRESNGCTSLPASVTLETPIEPYAPHVFYNHVICIDEPGSIVISQQNFGETYSIDFGATFQPTSFFHDLPTGTYGVVIKSRSGCISPVTFVSIFSLIPLLPEVTVTQPICHTPTGSISVVMRNWSDTYSFDDGATFQSDFAKDGLLPGIYSIRVRTAAGCVSEPNAVEIAMPPVVPLQPFATVTQPSCTTPTGSVSVDVQQATDEYSFDNGTTFQSSPIMSGLLPGQYKVVVRNVTECLSEPLDVVISSPPVTPEPPVVTLTQPTCYAPGAITVTAQRTNETYSFDNGLSFQTSSTKILSAATYQVVIKSNDGCLSLATSATIVDTPPAPSIPSMVITQPTCDVSVGSITVAIQDENDTYSFDGGTTFQSSPTKQSLTPGHYLVAIQRKDGCTSVGLVAVINQQPVKPDTPVITIDGSDPAQPLLISSSGPRCKWLKDGNQIIDQVSTTLVVTSTGSYSVAAISDEGCESEPSGHVEIVVTGIEETSNALQLYPNPTEDQIVLNLNGFVAGKEINIKIFNTFGMVVKQTTVVAHQSIALGVAQLARGEYILLLQQSEKTVTSSFIKK